MRFDLMLSCPEDWRLIRAIGSHNTESARIAVSHAAIHDRGRHGETSLIKDMPGEDSGTCRVLFNAGSDFNCARINRYSLFTFQLPAQAGAV